MTALTIELQCHFGVTAPMFVHSPHLILYPHELVYELVREIAVNPIRIWPVPSVMTYGNPHRVIDCISGQIEWSDEHVQSAMSAAMNADCGTQQRLFCDARIEDSELSTAFPRFDLECLDWHCVQSFVLRNGWVVVSDEVGVYLVLICSSGVRVTSDSLARRAKSLSLEWAQLSHSSGRIVPHGFLARFN